MTEQNNDSGGGGGGWRPSIIVPLHSGRSALRESACVRVCVRVPRLARGRRDYRYIVNAPQSIFRMVNRSILKQNFFFLIPSFPPLSPYFAYYLMQ